MEKEKECGSLGVFVGCCGAHHPKSAECSSGRGPGVGPRVPPSDRCICLASTSAAHPAIDGAPSPACVLVSPGPWFLLPDSFRLKGLASSRSNSHSARSLVVQALLCSNLCRLLRPALARPQRSQPNPNSAIVVSSSTHLSSRPANFCFDGPTS